MLNNTESRDSITMKMFKHTVETVICNMLLLAKCLLGLYLFISILGGITGAKLYDTILMHQLINLIVASVTSLMNPFYRILYYSLL